MTLLVERIDSVPLQGNEQLTFEIQRWMATLVDTLNTIFETIEPLLLEPIVIADTTYTANINSSYINSNALATTITLPLVAPIFSRVKIAGLGAGGWIVAPAVGQTIKFQASSASTSVASAERYDACEFQCIVDSTTWEVTSYSSTGLVIT